MCVINLPLVSGAVPDDDGIIHGGLGAPLGIAVMVLWAIGFARVRRHQKPARQPPAASRP